MDTIFALSSGQLPCAVAIIRVSGPLVKKIVLALSGKNLPPRFMHYGFLRGIHEKNDEGADIFTGEILDDSLTVFFPGPFSFTGEDCAEFHIHGGKAVVERFLEELSKFPNCRIAEAGEFSKRAFLNRRIDLTQAEGLADLLEAETQAQRRLALSGASGELAKKYRKWKEALLEIRVFFESNFDFSEEEDVSDFHEEKWCQEIFLLEKEILEHILYGEELNSFRDGLKITIIGAPNAGKSSLINYLSQREVALVSDIAGTTRDVIEVRLNLFGHLLLISDTAGIRETSDELENLGIKKAFEYGKDADLIFYLEDLKNPQEIDFFIEKDKVWVIGTKLDKLSKSEKEELDFKKYDLCISVKTEENLPKLFQYLEKYICEKSKRLGNLLPVRRRQIDLLKETQNELKLAMKARSQGLEFTAEHLRKATHALGKITGDVDVEEFLGLIFSQFCIGK